MNRAKYLLLVVGILIATYGALTVRPSPAKDEWLPISPEDLALKDNPANPGSDAMILYRESSIEAENDAFHEYVRIKIFTQQGTRAGDVEVPFIKGSDNIEDVRGRTIHPDGSIANFEGKSYEKEIVKASGFKFLAKTFTLPDVQPGSIVEYKFRDQYRSKYHFLNFTWIISSPLFTREGHFSIKPNPYAFYGFSFRQYGLGANQHPQEQPDKSYTLVVHDVKGIEDEPYMLPENALRMRVKFFYITASVPSTETNEQYWNRAGKTWNEEMEKFIDKKRALSSDLGNTVSPGDAPEVKLQKIYARVQKIRNVAFEQRKSKKEAKEEEIKPNANVEDLLKRGYGDPIQINYLFIGLARAAGFEATDVRVTPRNDSFFLSQVKDATQLDAEVVWVRVGGKEYFLNPSDLTYPFGLLPWYEAGVKGIRVSKDGDQMVETPLPPSSASTILCHGDFNLSEDGALSGQLRVEYTGQAAAVRRGEDYTEDEVGRKKKMEKEIQDSLPPGTIFELTKLSDWDDVNKPIQLEGTVKLSGYGSAAGRRMLVSASMFEVPEAKAFRASRRVNMIYFHYPGEVLDELQFHPPAGYTVETLPAAQDVNPGALKYNISMTQQASGVTVKRHLVISAILIPVQSYSALRQFFNTVKSDDEAQVVFQNTQNARNN
jgi:Domain of Unknown Function with PDB structure (DUF3857)